MIYYLTAARTAGAMGLFLQTWGKSLAGRVRILTYERIFSGASITLTRGTYIFTSLGQSLGSYDPPTRERKMIAQLRNDLVQKFGPQSVLNDPLLSLRRLALLQQMRQQGYNRFAAYHAAHLPKTARFPVFLRDEFGTKWGQVPLLHNREEYQAALARESPRDGLLALEFCNTADATGVYRKYGAFVVGERIVPRHLFFSREWLVKSPDLMSREHLAEECAYLEANPHADTLLKVCRLANIEYGRVDYALLNGRVQIWEINTTPAIVNPAAADSATRQRVHERFTQLFAAALDAIEIDTV